MRYIHKVWFTDTGKRFSKENIVTKKLFRKEMIDYYENGGDKRISFCLVGLNNIQIYRVIPYINIRGNISIAYTE